MSNAHAMPHMPELQPEPDMLAECHGSQWLFTAKSEYATDWWSENVSDGPMLGNSHAVEWRFAQGIIEGARADGLEIEVI